MSRERKATVLVTGGTGFVGRHLLRHLADTGRYELRCLVRRSSDLGSLRELAVERVEGDLTDPASLRGAAAGADLVLHSAAAVHETVRRARSDSALHDTNVAGTLALAREALAAGARRMVYLSSTAAMGPPRREGPMDESHPCRPAMPYGRSKRAGELELLALHRSRGLDVVIVRPCLVVGTGERPDELLTLFRLVRRGLFPLPLAGRPGKPLVHVSDVAAAVERAAIHGRAGAAYLVTSGETYPLERVVEIAGALLGVRRSHVRVPVGLARAAAGLLEPVCHVLGLTPPLTRARLELYFAHRVFDIGRARRELGYAPRVTDLESMLREVFDHFKRRDLL